MTDQSIIRKSFEKKIESKIIFSNLGANLGKNLNGIKPNLESSSLKSLLTNSIPMVQDVGVKTCCNTATVPLKFTKLIKNNNARFGPENFKKKLRDK